MIRGLLVSAIYKKTTEISITAIDNKASLTLMSADVEQINRGLRQVNELWASFIEFGLATYLLEWQIGPAAVAPFFVVVIAVAVSVRASAFAKAYQGAWFKKIQKRIGITSSMLGSMKGIKMAGLTDRLSLMTQGLRVEEVSSAGPFRMLIALLSSIGRFRGTYRWKLPADIRSVHPTVVGTSCDVCSLCHSCGERPRDSRRDKTLHVPFSFTATHSANVLHFSRHRGLRIDYWLL